MTSLNVSTFAVFCNLLIFCACFVGVYTTDIDLRQHKVIVTGDIDAETLIRKLEKNGKHAELWPEKAEHKEKKQGKAKNKEKKQNNQESSEEGGNPAEKETVKVEVTVQDSSKNRENENGGSGKNVENGGGGGAVHVVKINEGGSSTSKAGGVQQVKEPKPEVKQTVTLPAGGQSPAAEKKVGGESEAGPEKSGGGGSGGKKKKKKGHKGNNSNNAGQSQNQGGEVETFGNAAAAAGGGSGAQPFHGPSQGPMPSPANYSPPRQQYGYQYPAAPPQYYAPPVCAVSYNTAYPRASHNTSYYAVPATPSSYVYEHAGSGSEQAPSEIDSYPSQPTDSFEIFSDENPNACSIM